MLNCFNLFVENVSKLNTFGVPNFEVLLYNKCKALGMGWFLHSHGFSKTVYVIQSGCTRNSSKLYHSKCSKYGSERLSDER